MFQITVATHHDANAKVVEWPRNEGVKKFRFLVVVPPDTVRSDDSEHFGFL
jgi:hypothetical protein